MINILSPQMANMQPSAIQKALCSMPSDVISFSLGMPDNSLLPIVDYKKALSNLWMPGSLQYAPPLIDLKHQIIELMKHRGVDCTINQIFLTNGAQQAIYLLCKLLVDNNEEVITDAVSYPGFIQAAQSLNISLLTAPMNFTNGIELNDLENLCQKSKKPKFIYTMSEGHNPLGISLSKEKRLKLVELAKAYHIPIIEDDAYGFLNYQVTEPCLKSYNSNCVFYIGTFSKILAPAARVGWVIAPESIIEKLAILKESSDINTATFSQRTISSFLEKKDFFIHLSLLRETYTAKRDRMITALKKYIPEIEFEVPKSGFFIWIRFPQSIDTNQLFWKALNDEKVSFLPGSVFNASSNHTEFNHCIRLSFSHCPLERIESGIQRLAKAFYSYQI